MRRIVGLVALALVSTSCRSMLEVHESYRFEEHPRMGLVVVSTRIKSECGTGAAVEFESTKGDPGSIVFDNSMVEPDFKDPTGYFWVMQLPAGRYKFHKLQLGARYSSRAPINAGFTVTEGQTTYLGELRMEVQGCQRYDLRVLDRWEDRDAQLFGARMKNVTAASVGKQILEIPARVPVPASAAR